MTTKKQDAPTTSAPKAMLHPTRGLHSELIWSYWMEESMLVLALSAIARRFQNIKGSAGKNPLEHLDTGPLLPLSNLLWGYIQDEQHRTSVRRRNYEYDHHYGISLKGEATRSKKEKRSDFEGAWNDLLEQASAFLKIKGGAGKSDKTKLLGHLRKVQQILTRRSVGSDPQATRKIRREMHERKKLLALPEIQSFLGIAPPAGSFQKRWTSVVDKVKAIEGWDAVASIHYQTLATTAEKLLISIRMGNWNSLDDATRWAQESKNNLNKFIKAYRLV